MPLKPSQIRQILSAKREDFSAFDRETLSILNKYRDALNEVSHLSPDDIESRLGDALDVGARPLESLAKTAHCVLPCKLCWPNREQSLAWVRDRLTGVTTFAVDGSQIYPSKDLSIPIALVQIGWFENLHLPTGNYEKDVELDVMTPQDLQVGDMGLADRRVNMRRFQMETEKLISYMEAHPNPDNLLVFLDGSLVASFADAFDIESRKFYVDCLVRLLKTSEDHRVPLVAYIATSSADDLTGMLRHLMSLPESQHIHDAQILSKFMNWGDRTPLFLCQRPGILADYGAFRNRIAFTYLKTTREGYPARLELPLWMQEEPGLINRVMDWVRGEVIVGGGYPYVIETADQVAVLQAEDRQTFYRILQDWADQEHLNLRFSPKMVSKARRRA
ncbi:MAG: DNA double-strand break repair nuclease NurA [Synechococcales cyanobacterium T60_A2020_003]|nr:DNA double-strand break repair nuclease NurA [Synechococcales cyanobacterium T60_A2020_003]